MIAYIPNILTVARIVLTAIAIVLVPFSLAGIYFYLFFIFVVAALTDFADGYLARKFAVESDFGKMFDPLSDKVLTFVFLILLYGTGLIPHVIILLLIVRDLAVDGVRNAFAARVVVPAIMNAKIKTTLIFLLIISALFELAFYTSAAIHLLTLTLALLALVFSYISAVQYAQIFYRVHQREKNQ